MDFHTPLTLFITCQIISPRPPAGLLCHQSPTCLCWYSLRDFTFTAPGVLKGSVFSIFPATVSQAPWGVLLPLPTSSCCPASAGSRPFASAGSHSRGQLSALKVESFWINWLLTFGVFSLWWTVQDTVLNLAELWQQHMCHLHCICLHFGKLNMRNYLSTFTVYCIVAELLNLNLNTFLKPKESKVSSEIKSERAAHNQST